jgi:RNA polymerase sigma-70 factor (ECF subfamily)
MIEHTAFMVTQWARGMASEHSAGPPGRFARTSAGMTTFEAENTAQRFAGATMPDDDIRDLVRRAQAGDRQAIDRLLVIVRPHLERLAHRFKDRHYAMRSADDLVQDAWFAAWQKLNQFHGTDQAGDEALAMFQRWVGRILIRLGLNAARDRKALRRNPGRNVVRLDGPGTNPADGSEPGLQLAGDLPSPSTNARMNEQDCRIQEAMARCLNTDEREIIRLEFFEGLTLTQVAARLGLTYDQVRERHRVAMRRLERELEALR